MNKELIDRAAASYADSIPQFDDRKRYCREDFIAGVEWALGFVYRFPIEIIMKSEAAKTTHDLPENNS